MLFKTDRSLLSCRPFLCPCSRRANTPAASGITSPTPTKATVTFWGIGINPSTAQPGALDPTLKSVERLAAANGFDSWIMFNVYPQRATDPNDMDKTPDRALCDENLRWLQAVLAQTEPTMWAAWGTLIEKRDYLPGLMREMVALTREREIPWVTFGRRSKKGHPHHPLYLRKDSTPEPFDVENYLDTCF